MIFYFLHPAAYYHPHDPADQRKLVPLHEPAHNTAEGSEFLDDALRMDDEPVMHTEESVAPGSHSDLL